ncbi:PKD domain-containing protein [Fulvivirga lutea]|uniref:PKD domain-containing protein n=1 Tax=Fulvivirga lutea TaxID=2810512 RepID=A0A974WF35_9BACT|nr:PKD domain-containing protein [Fulvivirga lutea]QSE97289.1 PKD domain-containing protein [Fulvivirga lutea]
MKIKYTTSILFLFIGTLVLIGINKLFDSRPERIYYEEQLSKLHTLNKRGVTNFESLPKRDRPDLAYIQEFEMTMDPKLGYPPVQRQLEAFSKKQSILANKMDQLTAIPGVQWNERGPNNVAGRTRALMFDPNDNESKKVWAGAIGGGLWYNDDITDPTKKWVAVDDMLDNLAISSLAYDPNNSQIFYMGTGLGYTSDIQGLGIWKTTDGGNTWSQLANTDKFNFHFVQKIEVTDESTVIASTLEGLYRSTDGGSSWNKVIDGRFGDVEIASNGMIIATQGVNSSGAIFKSTDDGLTWSNVTPQGASATRIEVAISPSNPNIIYAVADGGRDDQDVAWFKKSVNSGENWEDVTIPLYMEQDCSMGASHFTRGQAFFDLILAVHPNNPSIVIAGGIDLHKSSDGGISWQPISYWTGSFCDDYVHADQHEITFRPGYPNEAIFGSDGGVSYSANVGNSNNPEFDDRNLGYNVTTFYSVAIENSVGSNYMLAGAQDNGTQKFTRAGVGSTLEATGGDGGFCFIDQDNPNYQITSFVFNSYRWSSDGGRTFTNISDDQSLGRFINPSEYDSESDILYGAGGLNQFTRITDITSSPSELETIEIELSSRQITTIKASPYTSNRLFVGVRVSGGEGLIFSIDNAHTSTPSVTEITGNFEANPGGWVSSIDVGATDDQLLVTFSNYGVSSVYETTDGGTNWISKEDNLPDMPVRWGLYNPENYDQVMLATELGVWSTNSFSGTPDWEPTNSGLANVRCDMLRYRESDGIVSVATYGRGVFTTNIFAKDANADFQTDQVVAYVGVPVQFSDNSLLPNNDWTWNFGDGTNSSDQNPTHTYNTPGHYTISLSIDGGVSIEEKINYVTILPVKSTPYLAADGGGFESNPDDFTSKSLLNGIDHWERGAPGNRLTTVNSGTNTWKTGLTTDISDEGFDYICALYSPAFDMSDNTKEYKLSFYKSMENGYCNAPHGLQLQYSIDGGINWFTLGTSQGELEGTNWYNRGDNTGCSIEQSVFFNKVGWNATSLTTDNGTIDNSVDNEITQYLLNNLAGQANVSFRFVSSVNTGSGNDNEGSVYDRDGFMIDDFEIIVSEASAEFTANQTIVSVDQQVEFTYLSNGAQSFAWDFGDGTASDVENPIHLYSSPGIYTVSLEIVNNVETLVNTKTDYIIVLPKREVPYLLDDGGDFETNTTDFGAQNITGTGFELGNSPIDGKDGTASGSNAWVIGLNDSEYVDDSEARLISPTFAFNTLGNYTLEFKSKHKFEDNWDGFIVEYSVDLGDSWVKLNNVEEEGWYNQISDPLSVFGANQPIFSGDTQGEFVTFSTDVSFLYPNNNVIFRFLFLSDAATVDVGMALDDFQLLGPEPGPAVADFSISGDTGCDGQVLNFINLSNGTIESLTWDFGLNATPQMAEGIGPHTVTYESDVLTTNTVVLTAVGTINGEVIKEEEISIAPLHQPEPFVIDYLPGNSATLTASTGDEFQWLKNGEEILGETDQTITINEFNVDYSVLVGIDGCFVESDVQTVISSIYRDSDNVNFNLYPNPIRSNVLKVTLDSRSFGNSVDCEIYNLFGTRVRVYRNNQLTNNIITLDITGLSSGSYLLKVINGNNVLSRQIIVNR